MEFKTYTREYYTDGSCLSNPGSGGYGVALFSNGKFDYKFYGKNDSTTNNRMELTAIIEALKDIKRFYKNENCIIYTDSAYCCNMLNAWIYKWAEREWVNEKDEPIKNPDLVKEAFELVRRLPNVDIVKVKGHDTDIRNELVDAIATHNIKKYYDIFASEDFQTFF